MKKRYLLLLLALTAYSPWVLAQSVTLANDGVYVSRMTTSQRNAIIAPTTGQLIYNTNHGCFNVYQQNAWKILCGSETEESWSKKADFGGAGRENAVGFSINGKGYIGTGFNNSGSLKDFWEYDGNAWTQKADFGGVRRSGAVGFSINGKGYIGMGYGVGGYLKDFWEYDPTVSGGKWTKKTDFGGAGREYAVGFSLNGKGYIGTGYAGGYLKDFWEYDPTVSGGKWAKKTNFGGGARSLAVGFSINGKGYIGTGASDFNLFNDFWGYNPGDSSWTNKADFGGVGRAAAVGFSLNNKGYIGTGQSDSGLLNDFWEYDTEASAVTQQGNSFNAANQLLKLDASAKVPAAILPTTMTQQGNSFNGANQLLQLDASAQLPVPTLPTTVTQQGNSFNGANQLLQLDASAKLPRQLWVSNSAPHALNTYYYMVKTGVGPVTGNTTPGNYSIVADQRISAMEFNAYSDARIKTVLGRSDAEKDLHLLQQLRITDYVYKDKLHYGSGAYKKVIAQEVEAVYPQAVSRKTEFVPDIYQKAKSRLLSGLVMEMVLDSVSVWQAGQKLKLISTKGEEVIAEVTESGEGNRVRVKSSAAGASEWFVYGRQVDDFRAMDYEALSMLHLSATQQLVRKMQQDRQRIDKLEKDTQRISQLERDNEWMKEQLQLIKAHLLPTPTIPLTAEAKP